MAGQNEPQEGTGTGGNTDPQNTSGEPSQNTDGAPSGDNGGPKPLTYTDVLASLTDEQRAAVTGEVSKKNSEARSQRDKAKENADKARLYDEAQSAQQTAEQKAQEAARRSDERVAAMRARVATAEVRGLATAKFADPEDAVAFLDTMSYVNDDGEVDSASIQTDLDDLLSRKPHLGKGSGEQHTRPGRPAPDRSQGSSANGSGTRTGVDAGAELYRQRHQRPGGVTTTAS